MKLISIDNSILSLESVDAAIDEQNITLTCTEDMDIEVSDEDYVKLCSIIDPCDIREVDITTLAQLARIINSSDEWPIEANRAIRENGWIDDTDIDRGICHTDAFKVVMNDAGLAVVLPNEEGIVNQLKAARIASGLTQQQVADKMGIAQTALSRIEACSHSPSLDMIERYADAIGMILSLTRK